jgi:hypothetical protein
MNLKFNKHSSVQKRDATMMIKEQMPGAKKLKWLIENLLITKNIRNQKFLSC